MEFRDVPTDAYADTDQRNGKTLTFKTHRYGCGKQFMIVIEASGVVANNPLACFKLQYDWRHTPVPNPP